MLGEQPIRRVGVEFHWSECCKTDTKVAAYYSAACGIKSDGTLWCWGNNDKSQLGVSPDGTAYVGNQNAPVEVGNPVVTGPDQWSDVAIGQYHTCAIFKKAQDPDDQTLWCWGNNSSAQLGLGDSSAHDGPKKVGAATWLAIWAGDSHTCGLQTDKMLWCWGANSSGQTGAGATPSLAPTEIGTSTWKQLGLGRFHSCGIDASDNLYCWGLNDVGQLGDKTFVKRTTPVQVDPDNPTQTWLWVDAHHPDGYTCGIKSNGTLWCWGTRTNGAPIGTGTFSLQWVPTQVIFESN